MLFSLDEISNDLFLGNLATSVSIGTLRWCNVGLSVVEVARVLFPDTSDDSGETGCDDQAFDIAKDACLQNGLHTFGSWCYHLLISELSGSWERISHVNHICSPLHSFEKGIFLHQIAFHKLYSVERFFPISVF